MNTSTESSTLNQRPMLPRLGMAAVTCLLCASMVLISAQTQPSPKPFTKDEVVKLLTGSVPVTRVEALVRKRGIDFQITPETELDLRKAGATDPLLTALRDLAPKPATLVVTTTPGGARVHNDDEFLDTTSAQGRLKISTLAPGQHHVRVSLDGYWKFDDVVELPAGQNFELRADLKPYGPPASSQPLSNPTEAEKSNSVERFRVLQRGH